MADDHLHFVTGRLAAHALERTVASVAADVGFSYSVQELPISVAALITTDWLAKHVRVPTEAQRIIVPGYCTGNLEPLEQSFGGRWERGPRDLRTLPQFLRGELPRTRPLTAYDIEILAEINHVPRLTMPEILSQARRYRDHGADVIDLGCDPGSDPWSGLRDCVRALRDLGMRVSVDSLNPIEIMAATQAGAELVLSVNGSNRHAAVDWGTEVVVIPDDIDDPCTLEDTIAVLEKAGVPYRIDPVLSPIGFGFAASLRRYFEARAAHPRTPMLMGIGNLTELTDVDSAGINVLLLAVCQELQIRSVLTTEVITWAQSSVRECDRARRLVFEAVTEHVLPKHLSPELVLLRDATVSRPSSDELHELARMLRDRNLRIFVDGSHIHVMNGLMHLTGTEPYELFRGIQAACPGMLDAAHAFYLGHELAKATTALALGKQYTQDESLSWGFLTVPEVSHRSKRGAEPPVLEKPSDEPVRPARRPVPGTSPHGAFPIFRELQPPPDPDQLFRRFAALPNCLFLDSSQRESRLGRYSFLTADPYAFRTSLDADIGRQDATGTASPWSEPGRGCGGSPQPGTLPPCLWELQRELRQMSTIRHPELPPFQGGVAGLFGYELARALEGLPRPTIDEFRVPALAVGFYDVVIAWDHLANRAWIVSQGLPETDLGSRKERAEARLAQFAALVEGNLPEASTVPVGMPIIRIDTPLHPEMPPHVFSNLSSSEYRARVSEAVERICRGDVFQVNLSQRLVRRAVEPAANMYRRLRQRTPATFGGYFDLGQYQLLSVSPERFLRLQDGRVEARPIKGTRRRLGLPEADLFTQSDLTASEKDFSENTMIVDLMRNDLARVCEPDSVIVPQWCGLETYGYVHHLVSVVEGSLRADKDGIDLLAATFPSGSVTGAPKVEAMRIITELEGVARGAYCGSLGYINLDGSLDLNVLIRTITVGGGWAQFPVGGGITAQSDPDLELQETWHKAAGMLKAFE